MNNFVKDMAATVVIAFLLLMSACGSSGSAGPEIAQAEAAPQPAAFRPEESAQAKSPFPDLQAELLDERSKSTTSPLGQYDFKNHSYPLPRGWENRDGSDLVLRNGSVDPVSVDTDIGMDPDEIAERKARRRIGASHVTTKYLDVTGDGHDEAVVILKIETTGSAIPQLVYVYEWKDGAPALLWNFRTGDRADGGLKDIRLQDGNLVIELYGQDRFLLGQTETGKITGDEEQLCCPTHFTRTFYKWNGRDFLMQGKRLTYSTAHPNAPPQENLGEIVNAKEKAKK